MNKYIFISALLLLSAGISSAQVSVVANKSVPDNALTSSKVSSIFSLEQVKWSSGDRVVVFDQNGDAKSKFYSAIGKDQLSMKKDWMKKQLTGEAKAPETLGSDADVIAKVSSTPGSIGYVNAANVTGGVKVLLELK
jgi:ABC-type phosphate transport system substrate-binding protein